MPQDFDKDYWEQHWKQGRDEESEAAPVEAPPNPYVTRETADLEPGTALDAGCGTGREALGLASRGWHVTAADISPSALSRAAEQTAAQGLSGRVSWVEADLVVWQPGRQFDLVCTNYAHPAMPQLEFYRRVSDWVAPGGTLLIVGHLHDDGAGTTEHGNHPPAETTVTLADVTAVLAPDTWRIDNAEEQNRTVTGPDGQDHELHDVVVRATRIS